MPLDAYFGYSHGSIDTANTIGIDTSYLERAQRALIRNKWDLPDCNTMRAPTDEGITRQYVMNKSTYDEYQALIKNERAKDAEIATIKQEMSDLKASRVMYKEITTERISVPDIWAFTHISWNDNYAPSTRIEVSPKEEIAIFIDAKRKAETALAKEKKLSEALFDKHVKLGSILKKMSKRELWKYVQEEL